MNFNLLAAEAAATTQGAEGQASFWESQGMMLVFIAIIGVAMYFLMIRPQKKKQKAEEELRNNIQVGDQIVTIGGFYGRVVSIKDEVLTIESPIDRTKQNIAKWAVQTNLTAHENSEAAKAAAKADKTKDKTK